MYEDGSLQIILSSVTGFNKIKRSGAGAQDLWCPDPELNQGHVDFQSTALPTELSGLIGRGGRI